MSCIWHSSLDSRYILLYVLQCTVVYCISHGTLTKRGGEKAANSLKSRISVGLRRRQCIRVGVYTYDRNQAAAPLR